MNRYNKSQKAVSVMVRSMFLLLMLLLMSAAAQAQHRVRGRVLDAENQSPLVGVNVVVPGTTVGTTTDIDGNYELVVPSAEDSLVFSYVGYETVRVAINGRSVIDISMRPVALWGGEVIVVGYTSERRRDVTGAVSGVSAEAISVRKVTRLEEALKGYIPGLNILTTGEPGEGARVFIRGLSFLNVNEPLYVVDGVYMRRNPNLNPNDIESIQVLKDASAAAQYGAQAANGVVVITTKRGQAGKPVITFNSYYGYQEIPRKLDLMNAEEWARVNRMAYENAGLPPLAGALNPTVDTDWQDAVFKRGSIMNYNLAVSGKGQNVSYYVSGDYLAQDGIVIETGFERYSLRINTEITRGMLTIGENISVSRSLKQNLVGFPLVDMVRMLPTIPVYDSTTTSGFGYGSEANYTFGTNPVGLQKMTDDWSISSQVIGSAFFKLNIWNNLSYKMNLGLQYEDFTNRVFWKKGIIRLNDPLLPARMWHRKDNNSSILWENLITYTNSFGKHNVDLVAGYTEQQTNFERVGAYREEYPDERLRVINAGTSNLNNEGFKVTTVLKSLLIRANYNYNDKYLVTGTFRRDGSSRFGPRYRWGNFYAGSIGWVVSEEPFYRYIPLISRYVNRLKLRASYGELGNQDIGDYAYAGVIQQNISYVLGNDAIAPGAIQIGLANPNIRWQSKKEINFGVDLNLFNYALEVVADYYISDSDGILVQAPLPPSLGSRSDPYVNAGAVRNSGFELMGSYMYDGREFDLKVSLNMMTVKNKVLSLGNNNQPIFAGPWGIARTAVGGPIGSFYVLDMIGIFQSEEDILNHTTTLDDGSVCVIQPNAKPGDVIYRDRNNDCLINDEDRYVAGNAFPDLEGGLFVETRYRNLDFSLGLRGVYGNEVFNVVRFWTDRMDDNSNYRKSLKPWTPENPSRDTPRPVFGPEGAMNATPLSDRWIEDGSYLQIQNIEIGYTFPDRAVQKLGVANMRIYLNAQNVYTFTKFWGWDPETVGMGELAPGFYDGQIFPNPRSYTLGLNITF